MHLFQFAEMRIHRNEYGIKDKPSVRHTVNVEFSPLVNVGDALGPVIVDWMLKKRNINPGKELSRTKHLMTVGSIIGRGRFDTTVWGSGILKTVGDNRLERYKKLYRRKIDFRAIRGPFSREIVMKNGYPCPEIYGDPAVLMPFIYNPDVACEDTIAVILHHRTELTQSESSAAEKDYKIYIDQDLLRERNIVFIDPKTTDYISFIKEMKKSRMVISSSLHGIILAEAYGIPAVFLNWGMSDQPLKFHDWYSSTGRELRCSNSLQQALDLGVPELPDLRSMQEQLMAAFPYDLWEE